MVEKDRMEVVFRVGGMHCASCAQRVESGLTGLSGVESARVNFATEKAAVVYNPEEVGREAIKGAVEEAGYEYRGVESEAGGAEAEAEVRRELAGLKRRFIAGFAGSAVLMVLMYWPMHHGAATSWLMLAIATPFFVYVGGPILAGAWRALGNRVLNMDVMYAMGIGVAYVASVLGTLGVVLTREFMFYETAVMLASFLMLGRYLEARAKRRTSDAIRALIGLQPKTARVERDGREREVPVDVLEHGDVVIVKPGERLPVDGEVVAGESYVDESMITGEPVPKHRRAGDQVTGGTINSNSVLRVKATGIGSETVLAQIIRLVEQAQGSRPEVQRIADRAVSWFIPVVLVIALGAFGGWWLSGAGLLFALTTLIAVLVIACPCALGLATPTAVTVGIGRGAQLGVLIKDGSVLELAQKISMVVFDKTGTLTLGRPEVTDVVAAGGSEGRVVAVAAAVERNSDHPLAKAVVRKAGEAGGGVKVERFDTLGGKGVVGEIEGREVLVGNAGLMGERGVAVGEGLARRREGLERDGKSCIHVAYGGELLGLIAIADPLKESAGEAVAALRAMGLEVAMVTGDNERTARAVARQAGIEQVVAEVLPEDKARAVQEFQRGGRTVAFVGDGINDAPALAQADIGIAVGSGTDVAMESGNIVIMKSDPVDVVAAIQLGRKVMGRIKQNLFWAFAYNTALIPVAAGVLWPIFGITFRPEFAGLAMALSSVTVVSLSLMLKRYVPEVRRGD